MTEEELKAQIDAGAAWLAERVENVRRMQSQSRTDGAEAMRREYGPSEAYLDTLRRAEAGDTEAVAVLERKLVTRRSPPTTETKGRKATGAKDISLPRRRAVFAEWNDYREDCRGKKHPTFRDFLDDHGKDFITEILPKGRTGREFQILAVVKNEAVLRGVIDLMRKAETETETEQ